MGSCCSNQTVNRGDELSPQDGIIGAMTADQIVLIVKIQSQVRRLLAKRYVQRLRETKYKSGMMDDFGEGDGDFNSQNVEVRITLH